MPWSASDAPGGLTQAQKARWARIANSALNACIDGGGSTSSCEGAAIRAANATVGGNMNYKGVRIQANNYEIRRDTLQGRAQIIVPVVMMVEGVHNGSAGPLFHSARELSHCLPAWDGIPVSIQHPMDDGHFVSCNSPGVIESQVVGKVFHSTFENGRLKAEAWLDEDRLTKISSEMLESILQCRPIEVSVGVFTDDEAITGDWNGEQYIAIARNHNPDHLALLIGAVGACSNKDGCGIRANKGEGGEKEMKKEKQPDLEAIGAKYLDAGRFNPLLACEEGYRDRITKIQVKLDSMDDDARVHFLTEVFDTHFIYSVAARSAGGEGNLYRRQYQINVDDSIEFIGEPVAVVKKVEYVVANEKKSATEGGVTTMVEKKKECKECPEIVKALVAHPLTTYAEKDTEMLLAVGEDLGKDFLTNMLPKEVEAVEKPAPTKDTPAQDIAAALAVLKESFKDPDTFLDLLPDAQREVMESGMALHKERRVTLIAHITRHQKGEAYPPAELDQMSVPGLQQVAKAIGMPVNYSVQGAGSDGSPDVPKGRAPQHLIKAHEAEMARKKTEDEGGEE